jgi:acetyl esterase
MTWNGFTVSGTELADDTRAFNADLAAKLAEVPATHEVDDPPRLRAARVEGRGAFPAPERLDGGIDRTIPGRAGDIPVRIFRHAEPQGVFLHIHGGGWVLGAADQQDRLLWALAELGRFAVVSVDYRLAPEHPYPAGPDDCEDAARWLIANSAAEFGTDRLVIGGESAGAHLTAVTLLRLGEQARAFRAAQFTFGVFDLGMTPSQLHGHDKLMIPRATMEWFYEQFVPGLTLEERRAPDISPLYADLSGMPPARFCVGTEDPLLDDSLFMAARWQAAGNKTELQVFDAAIHGFIAFPIKVAELEIAAQFDFITKAVTAS